jgi:hypothetical protein
VTINFDNQELTFELRRQGSVYVYEKTIDGKTLFYQLDKWHENAHPDYWSKDFYFEAEVSDNLISNNNIFTENKYEKNDYSNFISYLSLNKNISSSYYINQRKLAEPLKFIWILYKGEGVIALDFNNNKENITNQIEKLPKTNTWKWHKIIINSTNQLYTNTQLLLHGLKGNILLDKFTVSSNSKQPSL